MGILLKVEEVWRKTVIHDELKCEWDMHSAGDLIMCLGDINGHVGRHINGLQTLRESRLNCSNRPTDTT